METPRPFKFKGRWDRYGFLEVCIGVVVSIMGNKMEPTI